MNTHTPGPWHIGQYTTEIDERGESVPVVAIYSRVNGIKVAKMETWRGKEHEAEAEGNAALVAEAPEMLEALRNLIALADDPENEADDELVDQIDWKGIRALIAKVEGRA